MPISEKTLEINFARNFMHSHHYIWQGATLREEAHGGWDMKVDNLASGRSFILQFKRPYSISQMPNNRKKFVFYINNNSKGDQNNLLSNIAQALGTNSVFYALPCVENLSQLANPREAILWKTALVDINQPHIMNLPNGKHKVEVICNNGNIPATGLVYTEPKEINIMTVREYKEWGFEIDRLKDIHFQNIEKLKTKRLRIRLFTEIAEP